MACLVFLFLEPTLDNSLRGDASVICARHPKSFVTQHAMPANLDILQRVVKCMSQMQRAGNVRRWDNDCVGLFVGVGISVETALLFPSMKKLLANLCKIETVWNFFDSRVHI